MKRSFLHITYHYANRPGLHKKLYPTYNVALVRFAEDKEYNTVCFRALR